MKDLSSVDERLIIDQVLGGNPEAYAELVRRHQIKVRSLCLSLLANAQEGEDAAQDVFIKAYKSLSNYQGNSRFSTWLYRIAFNHCQDLLRQRSRRKMESWDEIADRGGEKEDIPALALQKNAEISDLLQKLLALLPEDYREILLLRETQGLNYQEIADVLDCSLDAVKARLRRARETLQEKARHFVTPSDV
jgi:RNA polymerase sigma-70 factor, ECF subfamily